MSPSPTLVGVRRELEIAAAIQRSLLPRGVPAESRGRFDLEGNVIPAREVGGDFYDYFLIDDRRLGFLVADVSGKGVGAALYMAVCRTLLRANAMEGADPGECLTLVNDMLTRDSDGSMFVTVCYAILDLETGDLVYALGAHPPPFVAGASGGRQLDLGGDTVLGLLERQTYQTLHEQLQPGDVMLFYSDGVNEAANARSELLSLDAVKHILDKMQAKDCREVTEQVVAAVKAFEGDVPQTDDITVLAVQWRGDARA